MITLARILLHSIDGGWPNKPPKRENGFGNRLRIGRPPERPNRRPRVKVKPAVRRTQTRSPCREQTISLSSSFHFLLCFLNRLFAASRSAGHQVTAMTAFENEFMR